VSTKFLCKNLNTFEDKGKVDAFFILKKAGKSREED